MNKVEKTKESKGQSAANAAGRKENNVKQGFGFVDNRSVSFAQRKKQALTNDSTPHPIQIIENNNGLSDNLKLGIENLSGYSMDDVKVHHNSDNPVKLQAHDYAQDTGIHLASGQNKHLPNEAWQTVQQKQGRVKPTMQMKGSVNINDDQHLEKEADIMGKEAFYTGKNVEVINHQLQRKATLQTPVAQRALLSASTQPINKAIYLYQNALVKLTSVRIAKGGKGFDADYIPVWPEGGRSGTAKNTQLDNGEGSPKFAELKASMAVAKEAAAKTKVVAVEQKKVRMADPVVIWQKLVLRTLDHVSELIGSHVRSASAAQEGPGKKEGVNILSSGEVVCVRHYQASVCTDDPYIAVKTISTGYAVMSNKGGIQEYDKEGSPITKGSPVKSTGRSHHCEAVLNERYSGDASALPAKATKAEGGHTIGGAASQNCLLCSLDSLRRGLPFDPHTNPPKMWNYQVTTHTSPLFPEPLLSKIMDAIMPLVSQAQEHFGITFSVDTSDQSLVDLLKKLNQFAEQEDLLKKWKVVKASEDEDPASRH